MILWLQNCGSRLTQAQRPREWPSSMTNLERWFLLPNSITGDSRSHQILTIDVVCVEADATDIPDTESLVGRTGEDHRAGCRRLCRVESAMSLLGCSVWRGCATSRISV